MPPCSEGIETETPETPKRFYDMRLSEYVWTLECSESVWRFACASSFWSMHCIQTAESPIFGHSSEGIGWTRDWGWLLCFLSGKHVCMGMHTVITLWFTTILCCWGAKEKPWKCKACFGTNSTLVFARPHWRFCDRDFLDLDGNSKISVMVLAWRLPCDLQKLIQHINVSQPSMRLHLCSCFLQRVYLQHLFH